MIPTPVEIDRSCRIPIVFLFTSAIVWLVLGLLLGLLSSIKLHGPNFLAGTPWLTYGRIYPASQAAIVYGFATQAGLAAALWMLARLGRTQLRFPIVTSLAAAFWNLAVTIGFVSILAGSLTGFEWLEMPPTLAPILFVSYAIIGIAALLTLQDRNEPVLYVSQWYLLAGLLWFPWIFSTANLLLFQWPARGVVQEVVNGWYESNLFNLWLTPVGLATIFYFLPKLLGRPLYSAYLAQFGFWSLALFGGAAAMHAGTPVPRWVSTLSIVTNVLLVVPLLAVVLNWHKTVEGRYRAASTDWILRFMLVGGAAYILDRVLRTLGWLRSVSSTTLFTYFGTGLNELFLFGFITMVAAGALFYILPRVTESDWPQPGFVRFYFWASVAGVALAALPLIIGGIVQGSTLNDPSVPFSRVIKLTLPFVGMNTLGILLLLAANGVLLVKVASFVSRAAGCCQSTPIGRRNV